MKNLLFALTALLPSLAFSMSATPTCDTLILKNGKKIVVKITSVDSVAVKYERCGEASGNQFSMQREFVWGIVSENPAFHKPTFDGVVEEVAVDRSKQRRRIGRTVAGIIGGTLALVIVGYLVVLSELST